MSVVVPTSTVGAIALPVLVGVILLAERPSAFVWAGILLALPAIALVSGAAGPRSAGTASMRDALISGAGFALQYVALAQGGSDAGLWPVAAGRFASVAANGAVAAAGLTLYMLAAQEGSMAGAVVLSSLYPVIPVVLGLSLLRERLSAWQVAGLVAASGTVLLVTIG